MVKKERSRRGGYGADDAGGGGGGNPSRRRYHGQSNRSGKQSRHISYIDKLKSGEKELRNYIDAEQFFKNLSKDYEDNKKLALNFDEKMCDVLKQATGLLHPALTQPLKLLGAMGGEALTQGVYKDRTLRCFETLYYAPEFFSTLAQHLNTERLTGPKDHSTIAWFLLQLGKSGNEEVLLDPLVRQLIDFFKSSNQVGFPQLWEQLNVVFQRKKNGDGGNGDKPKTNEMTSLEAVQLIMRPPGTRDHDNDKENYRTLSIIPTTSELQSTEAPYLPSADGSDYIDNAEAATLDRQFRLMREDLVGTVKQELKDEFHIPARQRRRLLPDPLVIGFGMKPEPHVIIRVSIPSQVQQRIQSMKNSEASEFFEKGPGKRILQHGTLVMLVHDATTPGHKSRTRDIRISAVGTVVERLKPLKIIGDPKNTSKKIRVIEVGVSFTPESMRAMTPLLQKLESKKKGVSMIGTNGGIFNASAGLFSLQPILKALAKMDQVPMRDQLIYMNEPKVPNLSHGEKCFTDLSPALQDAVKHDQAQKLALEEMFKSNTVLVQGPPGTGKTYIGVQMVKAMLEFEEESPAKNRPLRILCLCYTNHALDSFLLDLIEAGVPKKLFIRLGSSPKIDPQIKSRCLGEANSSVDTKFGREERTAYAVIKKESESLEPRFKNVFEFVTNKSVWGKSKLWWQTISEWLECEYYEEHAQLFVSTEVDSQGFQRVGKDSKTLEENYLWERWFTGKDRGIIQEQSMERPVGLWALKKYDRKALIEKWNEEWIQPKLDLLVSTMENLQNNAEALRTLRRRNDLRILKEANIIGCTTVAAAKFQGMINPDVVIVEEAGEILESHILANLGDRCEQLIMIGDHKQLRPKIDNYSLAKESQNGFDLNISLFERLVLSSTSQIPVIPLTVQHRMRPDISRIIRGMGLYDSLIDHDDTKGRNDVSGVLKNIAFIDHRLTERTDEESVAVGIETKVNPFEVDMVVSIAKYIVQQGQYSTNQITILTPYLGQLSLIRKKLQETKIGSYLSDQDYGDLLRHNLNDGSEGRVESKIRIATVDNFQGEESDIVIVSLVRSNSEGRIGFLTSEQRINVLFSRAREGMFVVGNLESLTECASKPGRQLWSNLKSVFESHNQLFDYFPAKCRTHDTLRKIRTPEDFLTLAPEGGCSLKCTLKLECGHDCPLKCHGNVQHVHSLVECKVKVEDICSNGHKQLRECYTTVKCRKVMEWCCPRGHPLRGMCMKGRPKTCKVCDMLDKLEEQARRTAEEQEEELRKRKQRLAVTKLELSTAVKREENLSQCKMLELEQNLLDKELSKIAATSKDKETLNFDHGREDGSIEEKVLTESRENDQLHEVLHDKIDPIAVRSDLPGTITCIDQDSTTRSTSNEVKGHYQFDTTPTPDFLEAGEEFISETMSYEHGKEEEICGGSVRVGTQKFREIHNDKNRKNKTDDTANLNLMPLNSTSLFLDADFCDAVERFVAKNFLEADDVMENCFSKKQSKSNTETLLAFQFIIHNSLDPSETKWNESHSHANRRKTPTSFNEAIQCWATFASMNEYPLIRKEMAELFLSYREINKKADALIKIGRNHANIVIDVAFKITRTTVSAQQSKDHEVERSIKSDWNMITKHDPDAPQIVNEVLRMTGLNEIKQALIDQYNRIRISQLQGDASASSYNVRFEGNPGTGKTTIARHYSKFLQQLTVLPKKSLTLDVTAASLKNKGISCLEEMLESIKEVGGGVIFIDEAYQLSTDMSGEKILDFILPICESLDGPFGKVAWIFAGYPKEMEKLFEHNVGLPSRFPQCFTFADYDAVQMENIFRGLMEFKVAQDPKKKEQQKKATNRGSAPLNRDSSRSYKKTAYNGTHGEIYEDRFGNSWTCDKNKGLWIDEFGNSTGYHPEDIGTKNNPLASKDSQLWEYGRASWVSHNGNKQTHYPGSPSPQTNISTKKEPRNPPFACEDDKFLRIAMRRLERQSHRPGFGNARTVRTFFDRVRSRQAKRISKENKKGKIANYFLFKKDDLLGIALDESQLKRSDAYIKLHQMEGLKPVKEQIDSLIKLGASNLKREESEHPLLAIMLNRVFLGNPGTGKTTVAKIYGQLLTEMGLLSKGEVIVKNPSDFRGDVLGSSEKSTRDILRAADGNVLVIDEAYALCTSNGLNGTSDPYGTAVIDTLVEQIQANPGDDRAVVMLGYRKEMENMFKHVNPGLSRRFQLEHAYEFPDYDDASLLKILRKKAKDCHLNVSIPVAKRAVRKLAKSRAKPNFGNGGAVDSLLSQAKERMQNRDGTSSALTIEDFAIEDDGFDDEKLSNHFEGMVGMDNVISKLEELKDIVNFAKMRGENPCESIGFNFLFLGNPGTGKTSIARCMGKMFNILGLLPDHQVLECTPKDFTTGFAGQAGNKTTEILEKSRGGVLFIDEAYQLHPNRGGPFMTEVVDELCAKLTDEEFKGKILVLLAGYDADMDEMLAVNPGLKSRFTERVVFNNLNDVATRDLIVLKLAKKMIPLSTEDAQSQTLLEYTGILVNSRDFANGRDVETVCNRAYAEVAKRSSDRNTAVCLGDVRKAIDSLINSRKAQKDSQSCVNIDLKDQIISTPSSMKEPPKTSSHLKKDIQVDNEVEDQLFEENNTRKEEESNPFDSLDTKHLKSLQDIVEEMDLHTEDGIKKIVTSTNYDNAIIQRLMEHLDVSEDVAKTFLRDWRTAHEQCNLQKVKSKKKFHGMEAIWFCAVCGRGGHPSPVCYVAPYISNYRPIPL